MDDFLNQINYPLVNVELTLENLKNTIVKFTQERFLLSVLNIDLSNIPSRFK